MPRKRSSPDLPTPPQEEVEVKQKPCEVDGAEDFDCDDCPEFDNCQMVLYDSYDESDDDEKHNESGLTLI